MRNHPLDGIEREKIAHHRYRRYPPVLRRSGRRPVALRQLPGLEDRRRHHPDLHRSGDRRYRRRLPLRGAGIHQGVHRAEHQAAAARQEPVRRRVPLQPRQYRPPQLALPGPGSTAPAGTSSARQRGSRSGRCWQTGDEGAVDEIGIYASGGVEHVWHDGGRAVPDRGGAALQGAGVRRLQVPPRHRLGTERHDLRRLRPRPAPPARGPWGRTSASCTRGSAPSSGRSKR